MTMRKLARKVYGAIPFKQPAFELLRGWVQVPEPVYRHLHFHGVIDVPVGDGAFRMHHHGTQIENELFWSGLFGRWEGESLRVWVRAARSARAILDVGANAGLYTLCAKAVSPHAAVAALEPVERIRAKLAANVALNRMDVSIVPAAASDRDGTGALLDTGAEHELSATLDPTARVLAGKEAHPVEVALVRLDTLVARGAIPPPDLVKIDVEGHEPAVLRGMGSLLERRPVLLVEVLTEAAAADVDALTRHFGYQVYIIDAGGPRRLERPTAAPGGNLLFCTAEAARALLLPERETAPPA